MANSISNRDDTIDSRDVIERIEELRGERDDFEPGEPGDTWEGANADDAAELSELEALADGAEGYCEDWQHGATLIRDSYFEDYARELADDLGLVNRDVSWPYTCIDWEQTASDLQQDYTAVEFGTVTYWVR